MKIDALKLQAKGWSIAEIEHAKHILDEAEGKKHPRILLLEKTIYWILLGIIIIGSIIGTWLIQPFLIFISVFGAIALVFISGIVFGSLASILVKDVENLELHHHLAISLVIPVTAIITSILISNQTIALSQAINITTKHNPILLGILYSIGSLIPFAILLWIERKEDGLI